MTDKELCSLLVENIKEAIVAGISGDDLCGAVSAIAKAVFAAEGFTPKDILAVWTRAPWPSQKEAAEMLFNLAKRARN